jgi:pantothenate kinase
MDGFHYPNQVLDSQRITIDGVPMPLRRIKGRPETFDLPSIRQSLRAMKAGQQVRWPRYDRTLHDPIPGAIPVLAEGIVIVEGLYMLLDLPGWRELRAEADWGVFVECPADVSRADLLARKRHQGRSDEEAAAHYSLVDHYTWQLTMRHRQGINVLIRIGPGRRPEIVPVTHEQDH